MFSSKSPILNAHGETRDTISFILSDFINDNLKLQMQLSKKINELSNDKINFVISVIDLLNDL